MGWGVNDINEAGQLLDSIVEEHKTPKDDREVPRDGATGTQAALESVGFDPDEAFHCAATTAERLATADAEMAAVTAYLGGLMVGAVLGKGEINGHD